MIEIEKIEKKLYPVVSNIVLSSVVGWALSFGIKYKFPEWFVGDVKIFSMLIITLFGYLSILYFFKHEVIQKLLVKYFNKKITPKENESDNIDDSRSI